MALPVHRNMYACNGLGLVFMWIYVKIRYIIVIVSMCQV